MPDESQVVWPEDPIEADARAAEAEPEPTPKPAATVESSWPATFEEALKESQAAHGAAEPSPAPAPAPVPAVASVAPVGMQADLSGNEYPTQPAMPAIPAKTSPPIARASETTKTAPPEVKTAPSIPAASPAEEPPTGMLQTQPPAPAIPASNGDDLAHLEATPSPPEKTEDEPEEAATTAEAAPEHLAEAEEKDAEPVVAAEPDTEPEPAIEGTMIMAPPMPTGMVREPAAAEEPEMQAASEPAPATAPPESVEPVTASAPAVAEPVAAVPAPAPEPQPAQKDEEWVPAPVNPPVPSWAPKVGSAPVDENVNWPGSNLPSWAPIGGGRSTTNMPAASRPAAPKPSIPIGEALPQSRPPAPSSRPSQPPQAQPAAGQPPTGSKSKTTSSWEIVQQKPAEAAKPEWAPSGEDRSYAEWFAWAKRSGAPATACHAAAQGAFRALAAGHDMNTAVQWATLAMASPPGLVGAPRQLYCAWYSLGNIDLKLPTPQAHAFAAGAIKALDSGADAPSAHQAGLAAAGITGP